MSARKPRLTLLCGLSASGKSQHISIVANNRNSECITISTDGIRENICGRVEDQSKNKEVFQTFHSLIVKYLKNGIDVVAEATNITMKSRRSILNVIEGIDCEKVCVVIVKPIGECKKDNIDREHPVPGHVIDKQARKFQIPFLEEGWDEIKFVDHIHNKDKYNYRLESTWIPEIYNDFDQKNPYHMESLGKHMTDAYDFSKKIHNDYSVLVATKYHDMGKLYTQTFDENGVAHYYGHENIGAYMMLVYEVANQHSLFVNHNIGDIAFYINYHMLPFQWKPISECDNKWIKIMGHKKYENLWSLHIADLVASKREKGLSEALKAKRGFDNEFDL
jgi:predicted kinase